MVVNRVAVARYRVAAGNQTFSNKYKYIKRIAASTNSAFDTTQPTNGQTNNALVVANRLRTVNQCTGTSTVVQR